MHLKLVLSFLLILALQTPERSFNDYIKSWSFQPTMKTEKYAGDDRIENVVVNDSKVFYHSGYSFGAVDRTSGELIWQKSWHDTFRFVELFLNENENVLFAGVSEHFLYKCDPESGKEYWRIPLTMKYSTKMLFLGNKLIVEMQAGSLSAIDTENHDKIWKTRLPLPNSEFSFCIYELYT